MADDPQHQPGAAEEPSAGDPAPELAELLGTTALTARVRCPCGKRQDVDREDWQWNGVAVCARCGRGILDHSLRVVSRREALAMIEGRKPTEKELRALRRMELSLRDFMPRYDAHPRWYWSPPTNSMADEVGRLLTELDESRRDRGAPPVVATGSAFLDEGDGEADEPGRPSRKTRVTTSSSTRGTRTRPSTRGRSKAVRVRPLAFWLTAAAASAAVAGCAVLWARARRDGRRAAVAELRLRRTRVRLRTAEAELFEADEYLAATGELLECYQEAYGALPVNPFAPAPAGDVAGDEWQEVLAEAEPRED